MTDQRLRIVYNALPLDPRGGGVSTYIRELLACMGAAVDARLVAAVQPAGVAELAPGITPMVKGEARGVKRALTSAMGFGPADLTHGLDVDLPLRRPGLMVSTVHDMAIFDTGVNEFGGAGGAVHCGALSPELSGGTWHGS